MTSKPFLFKIKLWNHDPHRYFLSYGMDEDDAKIKLLEQTKLKYNSGQIV